MTAFFRREKVKILKNLLLICCAFLCNFVAFNGAQSLQSSLNHEEGLGKLEILANFMKFEILF